jgi:Holliday junction resolvase
MKKIKEQDIQRQIIEYLTLKKWFVIKNNTVGIFVRKTGGYIPNPARGLADLTALRGGQVLMIEVKVKHGWQTPNQREFEGNWKTHGGVYVVVHSIEELIVYLSK